MDNHAHRFRTFRLKLLLLVIGILVISTFAVMFFTTQEVEKTMRRQSGEEAQNQLNLVKLDIENEYRSILYQKEYAMERYKVQLKNMVSVLVAYLDVVYGLYEKGTLTEKQAREMVSETVGKFKYGTEDYFLIYDMEGVVLSHPDKSIMHQNRSHWQDVKGNYVVKSFIDIAQKKGSGFYSYWFPRKGEPRSNAVEKLCYVELYPKFNWVVGTGVYIDDIARDTKKRIDRVMLELKDTLGRITIGKTGYFFLFDEKKNMLIHPNLSGRNFQTANPSIPSGYLAKLAEASKNPEIPYVYLWDKPPDHVGQYKFWKESYVTHFAPLGWYVASSVYKDDIEEPARRIIRWQAVVGAVVLVISILLALLLVRRMTIRLQQLTSYAQELSSSDFAMADDIEPRMKEISLKSQDEVGRLAKAFGYMIQALVDHIRRLKETTALKEKIESELRIAHKIQMSMVPHPPELKGDGFELCAALEPAKEVGGDLYDFFQIDDDHLGLIIGDVSDKGVPAALFMSKAKTLLRLLATATADSLKPAILLARANNELCYENELTMFVTLIYGILNVKTGELTYASAGHNPPFIVTKDGVVTLDVVPGLPLGAMEDVSYAESRRDFKAGEILLLYTDGVSEALNVAGQLFSDARLAETLDQYAGRAATTEEVIRGVVGAVKEYSAGAIQSDDITLLCVKYLGAGTC